MLGLSEDAPPDAAGWRQLLTNLETLHQAAEREHARSEISFTTLTESSPDAVFVTSRGTLRYANQAMATLLGYDAASALIGSIAGRFTHPEDVERQEEYRRSHLAGDPHVDVLEVRWMRSDQRVIEVRGTSTPIHFDGDSASLHIMRDVTQERRTELQRDQATAQLRSSEERYRALFEGAPMPFILFDQSTLQMLAVNDVALRLYGYERHEFLQLKMTDLKIDKDDVELREAQTYVMGGPRNALWKGVKPHRKKDGSRIEVEVTAHHVTVSGRDAILAMACDVTDKRKLEEQLRQSQKMEAIGQLAGGVAHDFNNILAVILADTDYVKEELGEAHPLCPQLDDVAAAAVRAAGLTHQLLAFSRRQILQPRVLALNAVVTELEKMLGRLIGENLSLEVELDAALGSVMADPGQLEQVIVNLVVNARDAVGAGGRIRVQTANIEAREGDRDLPAGVRAGSYVALTVADDGCGMDEAMIARVFEPFYTTKDVGRGTGLGLSTVLGIVEQSGGVIHVVSRVGQGTRFQVLLPRVDSHAASSTKPPRQDVDCLRGIERVLLVEDDPFVRRAATRTLERRGYSVVQAGNGEEAFEQFQHLEASIDLVVTDLVMPGLDGVEVAARLRKRHRGPLRILYMSGYSEHTALLDGSRGEPVRFLQKPFSAEQLLSAVRGALDAEPPRCCSEDR